MKKTALITGGAKGIGAAMVRTFALNGYDVVIHCNTSKDEAEKLSSLINSNGASAYVISADLRDESAAKDMVSEAISHLKNIDVLINNAGTALYKLYIDCTNDDIENILSSNVKSALYVTKHVLPHMLKRKSGSIINISSIWGISGASMETLYSTSKAALIGFTKALAKEVAPSNIRVNCIAPGAVDTDMLAGLDLDEFKNDIPLGRLGQPSDIAALAHFIASDRAGYITGQVISPNGGFLI